MRIEVLDPDSKPKWQGADTANGVSFGSQKGFAKANSNKSGADLIQYREIPKNVAVSPWRRVNPITTLIELLLFGVAIPCGFRRQVDSCPFLVRNDVGLAYRASRHFPVATRPESPHRRGRGSAKGLKRPLRELAGRDHHLLPAPWSFNGRRFTALMVVRTTNLMLVLPVSLVRLDRGVLIESQLRRDLANDFVCDPSSTYSFWIQEKLEVRAHKFLDPG